MNKPRSLLTAEEIIIKAGEWVVVHLKAGEWVIDNYKFGKNYYYPLHIPCARVYGIDPTTNSCRGCGKEVPRNLWAMAKLLEL